MNDFSATDAISAGFRLIVREPLAVLAWAVAYLVLAVLPQFAVMVAAMPDIIGFYQATARGALGQGSVDPATLAGLSPRMMGLQPLILLITIVSQTVLIGAIFRAVLQPQDRRFFYLRFGRQELWLGLAGLVLGVFLIVLLVVAMIPIVVTSVLAADATRSGGQGEAITALVVTAVVILGLGAILWLALRLSLAPVMSFAQGRFAFYESWSLTEGHVWKMFFVMLAMAVIVCLLEMVLVAIGWGVMLAVLGSHWQSLLTALPGEVLHTLGPAFLVFLALGSVIGMGAYAILVAPWASIYGDLAGTDPTAAVPPR